MEFLIRVHLMRKQPLKLIDMKRFKNLFISIANDSRLCNWLTNHFFGAMVLFSFVLISVSINAQTSRTIAGIVYDESKQPLPGACVMVEKSSNGKITDMDGKFSIRVSSTDKTLVFTFIGYLAQKVSIWQKDSVIIELQPDAQNMEEVVVVGYGTQRKSCLTGAISSGMPTDKSKPYYASAPKYEREDFNTESYTKNNENGFKDVQSQALSTFSIDVDRASYTNVRRFLNGGQLPPPDAVRVEEMINYFAYDYQNPVGDDPFVVNHEMAVCPWAPEHRLLKIALKGKEIEKENLPASNLVFLIDVSGSMNSANKLPLLKASLNLLVNQLRPNDRVAMVVYAGAAGVVLEPTSGNQRTKILDALNRLEAGGSTAGGAGLKLAYKLASDSFIKGGNNRIILATDGDFNVGASSDGDMQRMVEDGRDSGVFMTVLGFGMGNYKDSKLETIANKGNGNYGYIDNLQEAQKMLISEFGGTLFTIAKDVKFQLEFNPAKVAAYRLIGYENRLLNNEDFNDDKKDAGEMGAGHVVTALYELVPVTARDAKKYLGKTDNLKYQSKNDISSNSQEWLTCKLRYKEPSGSKSKLMEIPVLGNDQRFADASSDFRFASSVAAFGMKLSNSAYASAIDYSEISKMANASRGNDEDGYRAELCRLVKIAADLSRTGISTD